jgi:hypothetical protein
MAAATTAKRGISRREIAALALVLAIAPTVAAQSITDARRIEFTPSPDHDAVDPTSSSALVSYYTLDVFLAGDTVSQQTANLGKPTPDTDGMIRVDFVSLLPTALSPGVIYEAVVSAVGPGGATSSPRSNTFSFSLPCAYTLSPTSQSFPAAGGTSAVNVTTAAGCTWSATSGSSWVTISNGSNRSGSGSVGITAASNTTTQSRTATLTIAGTSFQITEQAATCSYTVAPLTITAPPAGGTGSINVTTLSTCAWTSTSGTSWISLTGSRTGSGTASYTIGANTGSATRTATVTVAGVPVRFDQAIVTNPTAPTNLRIIIK